MNLVDDFTNGNLTSGSNIPFWFKAISKKMKFDKLNQNIDCDVLIVGGGISGLTTAYCLLKEGYKVVLIEDGFIGSGESGRTTAQITSMLGTRYFEIEEIFDKHTAELVANSQMEAIQWITNIVKHNHIDCNFKSVESYLFLDPSDTNEILEQEYEATKRAGLITEMHNHIPGIKGSENKWCIEFKEQAQFHILKYLVALTELITNLGGKIFTETRAEKISKSGATANGFEIKAKNIVVATNTPINDWVDIHTKQWPYRSYVIAAKVLKGKLPYAIWNDTGDKNSKWIAKPYHYVRLEEFDDQYDILISGGEDHRTGQANDEQIPEQYRYNNLEKWTRENFPDIEKVEYKWSGQVMEPIDGLPFLGRNSGDDNIYIITGDGGNGMTNSTIGALIITDLINGKENAWAKIYSPSRITLNASGDYIHEAVNMVAQFGDWLTSEAVKETEYLKPGEGAIISKGMKKMAAYRDENNILHTCTAVCPHLGGIVQWNAEEKTFDCPLHGSRFTTQGVVINGPALSDLKQIVLEPEHNMAISEEHSA